MKKNQLKICNSGGINKIKIHSKKANNIFYIRPKMDIKEDKIYVVYEESEIKKCGFDKILRIEIYKDSKRVFHVNKITNFSVVFPCFSFDGIYEIRSIVVNSKDKFQGCFINTFEFIASKRKLQFDKLNIDLKKVNRHLNINFNKKFGDLDLSEITLSNINIYDSQNNKIKNISCKLYNRLNSIDLVMLEVFGDFSGNKLIPNEVYTVNIKYKNRELNSSFLFEYHKSLVKVQDIVEETKYEILSEISKDVLVIKLTLKINPCISIEDYEYFLFNVRSKILQSSSLNQGEENEIVFECIIKKEKNTFEFNMVKDKSAIVVKFDYDFTENKEYICAKKYFRIPSIVKNSNRYKIQVEPNITINNSNSNLILGNTDILGKVCEKSIIGKVKIDNRQIFFDDLCMLTDKLSEIYTFEINSECRESFVFSQSVEVLFNKIENEIELIDKENLKIKFLNNTYTLKGDYALEKNKYLELNIINNICNLDLKEINGDKDISLKVYDDNNKLYYQTINLNYVIEKPLVKVFNVDNIYLDSLNYLSIGDKNIFELEKDFEISIFGGDINQIQKVYVNGANHSFKIFFDKVKIVKSGIYYLKLKQKHKYNLCSFYVGDIVPPQNLFVFDVNNNILSLVMNNLVIKESRKYFLNVKLCLVMENTNYEIFDKKIYINSKNLNFKFIKDQLINNGEYILSFRLNKNKLININFTYLGDEIEYSNLYEGSESLSQFL